MPYPLLGSGIQGWRTLLSDANTADLSDCKPLDDKIINSTDKVAEIANKSANLADIEANNIHSRQSSSTTSYFIDVGKAPPGSGYYIKLTHWHRYNSYICRHRHKQLIINN